MTKNIIWDNWELDIDNPAWAEFLNDKYGDYSDDEKYKIMIDINNNYLDDERINLNIQLDNDIIVIADLGLWNGRKTGYKLIKSGNIKDCLYDNCDFVTWYCDRYNFRCDAIHHDGTNHYLYRVFRPWVTDEQKDNFLFNVYNGRLNERMIRRYTMSLRPYIANVYGWKGTKTA